MESDKIELAERLVSSSKWRWMPGMATVQGERVVLMDDDGTLRLAAPWGGTVGVTAVRSFCDSSGACLPDLTDPATLGCLLALVREAWEPYGTFVSTHRYDGGEWSIRTLPIPMFATEAEALVAALEGAL